MDEEVVTPLLRHVERERPRRSERGLFACRVYRGLAGLLRPERRDEVSLSIEGHRTRKPLGRAHEEGAAVVAAVLHAVL